MSRTRSFAAADIWDLLPDAEPGNPGPALGALLSKSLPLTMLLLLLSVVFLLD